jgi:hypothetical protein
MLFFEPPTVHFALRARSQWALISRPHFARTLGNFKNHFFNFYKKNYRFCNCQICDLVKNTNSQGLNTSIILIIFHPHRCLHHHLDLLFHDLLFRAIHPIHLPGLPMPLIWQERVHHGVV